MPVTTTKDNPNYLPDEPQPGDGEIVPELAARQGFRDRPILWVLMISLALVVVAFGIAFMTNNNQEAAAERGMGQTSEPAVAQQFDAPAPAPVTPAN